MSVFDTNVPLRLAAWEDCNMNREQEQTVKRRRVPDPHQRTITGGTVHLLWRIVSILLVVSMFLGVAGGVAAKRMLERGQTYLQEDIIPNAHYDLDGVKLNQSSFILAKNPVTGEFEELRQLLSSENRIWVNYEEIPQDMVNAAVAIEDKRFWEHDGVDWMRTLGASANMFIGGSQYGGSTLTQQLIKNLTGEREVTVRRKLTEIFKALDFEEHYTKKDIITWYLNTIYLGQGAYGVKSAAHVYFGKELEELTTKECACIVGITNNPSRYDPYFYPENNEQRTLTILQQMFEQGYIADRETYDSACDQKLEFKRLRVEDQKFTCAACGYRNVIKKYTANGDTYTCPKCGAENQFDVEKKDYYSYFEDTIIRDVSRDYAALKGITPEAANKVILTGGFRIYSTIDLNAQAKVDEVYQDVENVPKTYSSQQLQSGIVVIDNETGDIVAMAGGVGKKEGNLTWNRATMSHLSPGSSIKPLTVYGPALALGVITPGSAYENTAYMKIDGEDWPQNEDRKPASGWMLVLNALAQSLNTVSVKVLADLTPEVSFQFARDRFGLTDLVEHKEKNGKEYTDVSLAPLGLGQLTDGLTIREIATAYASFPNGGVFRSARTYTRVEDAEGNLIMENPQVTREVMSAHAAWYMVYMLRYACVYGTGANAQFGDVPVAGKTGTSGSNQDRWFSGFTPRYTATVWCGYDTPEEVRLVVNLNPSVIMWKSVMSKLLSGLSTEEIGDFVRPDDEEFVNVQVCSQTGMLAGSKCTPKTVSLFASDVPEKTCDAHLQFQIDLCYPSGKEGKSYCANNDCLVYHNIVSSAEFKALALQFPELNEFTENPIEKKTLYMLKDSENEAPTVKDALKANNIAVCTVHTHERLVELQKAVLDAKEKLTPEPVPDPEPSSDPDPDPNPDPDPDPDPDPED